jgi:hypothetical protein
MVHRFQPSYAFYPVKEVVEIELVVAVVDLRGVADPFAE